MKTETSKQKHGKTSWITRFFTKLRKSQMGGGDLVTTVLMIVLTISLIFGAFAFLNKHVGGRIIWCAKVISIGKPAADRWYLQYIGELTDPNPDPDGLTD